MQGNIYPYALAAWCLTALSVGLRAQDAPPQFPDAAATDPVRLGWMQGSPPPADKLIRFADGGNLRFPQSRWAFSHTRQMMPTVAVRRGAAPTRVLERNERKDIDPVRFTTLDGRAMTWEQSLAANYTDGIVVLHRGVIVYERYFGVLDPHTPHMAMSVTKSFIGTLGAMLVAEGVLDEKAVASRYVAELAGGAWGDASIRQLLDMTVGIEYSEDYADPKADVWRHAMAGNIAPRPPGYQGPDGFYQFLVTLKKQGEHGQAFAYKTVNTDALGWVITRVTGKSIEQLLSERIWQKIGAEEDAYMLVDAMGTAFAGGGLNTTLRDLARVGEMLRNDGKFNGQQIVPKAVVDDIRRGGDPVHFAKAGYATLPGWSYRDMWWVSHNAHGAFSARGVYGQAIYVDPVAEMVIARFASFPMAANAHLDPTSLPAYQALAEHLMGKPK